MKTLQLKRDMPRSSSRLNRRQFLAATGAGTIALGGCARLSNLPGHTRPKTVALVATEVRRHSHAQHFVDRFLEGYGWAGQWHHPRVQLVSLYVDQFPSGDLARERSQRFQVPLYPSVEEALTRGGKQLAVDGVIVIGEHGQYPRNEKGQTLYPRYRWFKQIVRVFESSGRSVPVFNDKHLSTAWPECVEMVSDSRRLGFPFLAGSSLPVTWRVPSIDVPSGADLRESVCVCYGGVDSYDFHGLETAQCMSERRRGGEIGVRQVHALRGDSMWNLLAQRPETRRLFLATLARSHTLRAPEGLTIAPPSLEGARQASPDAVGYFLEHGDGFRTAMFLCNNLVRDFTYAGLLDGGEILSCQMHLPMPMHISTTADFFNPLAHHIEEMILTGQAPYPVERTLLTSGMTLSAVNSLHHDQKPLATPELAVHYPAPRPSTFWRS